jgi:hypothetical protein
MLAATSSGTPMGRRSLYSRDNDAEPRQAKVLTKDEARRLAGTAAGAAWEDAALVPNGAGHAIHPEIRSLREPIAQREPPVRPPQGHSEAEQDIPSLIQPVALARAPCAID